MPQRRHQDTALCESVDTKWTGGWLDISGNSKYENTAMQYTIFFFFSCKMIENFIEKKEVFFFFCFNIYAQNIYCGHTPRRF